VAKIRKREGKNGVSWQIDYFDPNGKRVRQSFKKRKDAEAELAKRVSLIAEKRYLDVKKDYKTTLKELLDKYTENFQHQIIFNRWKAFCLKRFKDYFGEDTRLANIRYVDLETYRNKAKKTLTPNGTIRQDSTVNREMSCLHHVFTKAVEWEMMEKNPFDKGKSLRFKENNKRIRFLSKEEINRLLPECPKHLRRIVECAIHTGMRKGEILNLKWSHIRNGQIYLEAGMTKTKEARQIPINDDLVRLLNEIRKEQQFTSEYVFTYRKNEDKLKGTEPLRKRRKVTRVSKPVINVGTAFRSALKRAGIEDFRFHDLRHTFASHAIMKGATLKEVQELLGHKTIEMTMRYAHLSHEHKKKAVNLLNGLTACENLENADCHKTGTNLKSCISTTRQIADIIGQGASS
jgi:integrase